MSEHHSNTPPNFESSKFQAPHKKQIISHSYPVNMLTSPVNFNINYNIIENNQTKPPQSKLQTHKTNLPNQDSEALVQRWKAGNFAEFNRWLQISKADCKVEFSTKSTNPNSSKTFVCNMSLNFTNNPQFSSFFSSGLGKSKKEAKAKVIEKIVRDLIQKDCLQLGLKNENFENSNNSNSNVGLMMKRNYLNNKLRNMNYEITEFIKQDRFQEACETYQQLCSMKNIEWKDIFTIWTYGLLKLNITHINRIINLMNQEDQFDLSNPAIESEDFKKINQELQKRYGFPRLPSKNIFEIHDFFNISVHDISFSVDCPFLKKEPPFFLSDPNPSIFSTLIPYENYLKVLPQVNENQSFPLPKPFNPFSCLKEHNTSDLSENKGLALKIVNSLFDSLIYVGDLSFSLKVAELIYNRITIKKEDLTYPEAGDYFLNKKNCLVIELLESMFQLFSRSNEKKLKVISNLTGTLEKVREDFGELILDFTPEQSTDQLAKICLCPFSSEYKVNLLQIAEGDYVILTCFKEKNDEEEGSPLDETASLKNYLNIFSAQMKANNLEGEAKILINTLNEYGNHFEEAFIANVQEISSNYHLKLSILPSIKQSNRILLSKKFWKLTKMFNKETFDKSSSALLDLVSNNCMSSTLEKIILIPQKAHQEIQIFPQLYQNFSSKINNSLNSMQNLACTFSQSQPLTLVEGASGTGKTYLASEIILQWIKQSPLPILACSSHSESTNELFLHLKNFGLNVIKLGAELDEIQKLNREILFRQLASNISSEQYQTLNFKMTKKMISEAQIVCCTCLGSGSELLKNMIFTRVLIDEAHQVPELETLIPLVKKCQQLVMLGDRRKLPSKAISYFAQSKGMSISMFERLILGGIQPINLQMQYKMHPTISVFPSYHFYNNMLENASLLKMEEGLKIFSNENRKIRELFIQVTGEEEIYESSLINRKEIEMTINVLLYLINEENVKVDNIEILTLFAAQQYFIRREILSLCKKKPDLFKVKQEDYNFIANERKNLVDVNLIYEYPTKEKEIFICSTVRSNKNGTLGYLKDPRLFNTILTRSKNGVILIGNIETLGYQNFFHHYIEWAGANKIILVQK